MNGHNIELVIFDCDGVLIDSEIISAGILIDQLRAVGVNVDLDYVQHNFLGRSFPKVAQDIREHIGVELPDSFETEYRASLLSEFELGLRKTDGLDDMLGQLRPSACVATSSSPQRVKRSLELVGLDRIFAGNVFTASEVANGKPAPDLFLHTARSMTVAPVNCLIVEDSLPGIRAAIAAEMSVVRYVGASHLSGSQQSLPADIGDVPRFDKWPMFFDLLPGLRRDEH